VRSPSDEATLSLPHRASLAANDALDSDLLPAGTRIAEDLEIVGLIGRGGTSRVYLARDLHLGREVAVKLLAPPRGDDDAVSAWFARFDQEARATAQLAHPAVVTVHRAGRWQGLPYLVLERLEGATLEDVAREALPVERALAVAADLADALAFCHARGVPHHDVTPRNVWVCPDGRIKVLDLGLASLPGSEPAHVGAGTPGYVPPERTRGEPEDARGDVWALGAVLLRLLAGAPPGRGGSPADLDDRPDLPRSLRPLLESLLASEPGDRPSAAEAADRLRATAREHRLGAAAPYRYLDAFDVKDRAWFFGREAEVARLSALVDAHPRILLVGPSGAGKTSLLRAGLAAALAEREPPRPVVVERLGRAAMERLDAALRAVGPGGVVVIDAMEELYTLAPEVAAPVGVRLRAAARAGVCVVAGVREEFLSRALGLLGEDDPDAVTLMVLLPPGREALHRALAAPAARLGYSLEAGLADEMVAGLAGEAAPLPLLQLAASRLWEVRDPARRELRIEALHALGGVAGLLATHAEEVVGRLVDGEDHRAVRELTCALVTGARTRRPMLQEELLARATDAARYGRVLDHLVRGRILTLRRTAQGPVVELAHEALITRWDRLARWLDESGHERAAAEEIARAAAHWDALGRPTGLLWRGEALDDARRLLARAPAAVDEDGRAFVDQADRAARRGAHLRRGGLAAAMAATLALVIGGQLAAREYRARAADAVQQADRANAAEREARARALALQAREAMAIDGREALALAVSAWETAPTVEAADALRDTMSVPWMEAALIGHQALVYDAVFSPDGQGVASVSLDGTVRLWGIDGSPIAVLRGHEGAVTTVGFLPDGRVVSAGVDGTARLWPADGGAARVLSTSEEPARLVRLSPDGTQLAVAGNDGTVRIALLAGGDPRTMHPHVGPVVAAQWSPGGARLLTAGVDGTARIWDAAGGLLHTLHAAQRGGVDAIYSPDGARIATAAVQDPALRLWSADGRLTAVIPGHLGAVSLVVAAPRGGLLATASYDKTARLWLFSGAPGPVLGGHGGRVTDLAFSPDGQSLVTGDDASMAHLWDLEGREIARFAGHVGWVSAVDYSPDGTRVLTAGQDGTVRVWRLDEATLARLADRRAEVDAGRMDDADGRRPATEEDREWRDSVTPNGRAMNISNAADLVVERALPIPGGALTVSGDRVARLWDGDGTLRATLRGHTGWIRDAQVDPTGRFAVTCAEDGTARLWTLPEGAPGEVLPDHEGPVSAVAVRPDGTAIATADARGVRLWTPGAGAVRLTGDAAAVATLAWSSDGATLAAGDASGRLRVWSADGTSLREVEAHAGAVHRLLPLAGGAWATGDSTRIAIWSAAGQRLASAEADEDGRLMERSPDGDALLVSTASGSASLWGADGARLAELSGHTAALSAAAWFPDDQRLVTASADGSARVWDRGGRALAVLAPNLRMLSAVTVSRDRIAAGYVDGTVRLWTSAGEALGVLARHELPVLALAFDPAGRWLSSWSNDAAIRVATVDPGELAQAARERLAAMPEVQPERGRAGEYGSLR
jgi:WD40 repeat protein